jgi:3-hydroxyacyl-CoA dehydrogenase
MASSGMSPVVVRREVEGFVFNRLQGALLREAYCLVRDGVASVEDVDRVVRDGLGRRWSVIGPFETVDLNTRGGIAAHAQRLGPAYARMGAERGQVDPWTEELVAQVVRERRARLPLAEWDDRVAWRDRALAALEQARRAIA